MMIAFILKLIVGFILILVHTRFYGSGDLSHDGHTFMTEGKTLNNVFHESPIYYLELMLGIEKDKAFAYQTAYWSPGDLTIINDSKNVIRLHSIIHFFSGNQVAIHIAIFCFLALIGVKLIFESIRNYIKINQKLAFWILLLPPSAIFWTSSMMKESILILGIGLFGYAILSKKSIPTRLLYFTSSIPLLIGFKPYVGILLFLTLGYIVFSKIIFKDKQIIAFPISIMIVVFLGLIFKETKNKFVNHLTRKQFDFMNVGRGGLHVLSDTCFYYFSPEQYNLLSFDGGKVMLKKEVDASILRFGSTEQPVPVHLTPKGEIWQKVYQSKGCESYISITPINNSASQLVKNIPEAIINAVFRPFPGDGGSNLKYFAMGEVILMLFLTGFAIFKKRKLNIPEKRIINFLLLFSIGLFILIGLTTPVNGAIVRYRFPAQLASIIVILISLDPLKLKFWKNIS
jgi:hypothetical protein